MKIKGLGSAERSRGARPAPGAGPGSETPGKKKITAGALQEARALVWLHRKRMSYVIADLPQRLGVGAE